MSTWLVNGAEQVLTDGHRTSSAHPAPPVRISRAVRPLAKQGLIPPHRGSVAAPPRAIGAERGLIERDEVFDGLGRLFAGAVDRRGRLALVRGPMGSGKSEVLLGFLESVQQSPALVLSATACHRESTLPFGVLTQLFQDTQFPYLVRAGIGEMLTAMTLRQVTSDPEDETAAAQTAADLQRISLILAKIAEASPIVIGVDNLHYIDKPSLNGLCHIIPRIRTTRTLVVCTDDAGRHRLNSPLRSELIHQPHVRLFDLNPLSGEGIRSLLRDQLGEAAADRLAADFTRVSGGNPLVLRDLVHDHRSDLESGPRGYSRALLSSLHRCEPATLAVVRALAVLGDRAAPADLARLADTDRVELAKVTQSLNDAGLLCDGAFRDPDAAVDVLDDIPWPTRVELHRRAAEVMYGAGGAATAIAEQLVSADCPDFPWAGDVLLDAARDCLVADRTHAAVTYLHLAQRTSANGPFRAAIRARLSRLEWFLGPLSSNQYLSLLVEDASSGHLGARDLIDLVWRLSWQGKVDWVTRVLSEARTCRRGLSEEGTQDLQALSIWLGGMYPAHARSLTTMAAPVRPAGDIARVDPWLSAATLTDTLIRGQAESIAAHAGQVLQSLRVDFDSLWSAEAALLAVLSLVYADAFEAATTWCDRLSAEAQARETPTLLAVVTAVRAEISLRQGDLEAAAQQAQQALTLLSPREWGVALGLPLGCLILADTRMGRLETAAKHLARAVPGAMLQSRYGLHYLYARGHHRMITGHAQSALSDFLACGELLEGWAVRGTSPVPWRTSAAEACIQLGNPDQAKHLVREQLARLPSGKSRARGLSLRVLATAGSAGSRQQLLSEAVDVIKECGDKYELARALTDLSHAFQSVGDQRNARRAARRAWRVAKAAGAEPLCLEIAPDGANAAAESSTRTDAYGDAALSEQERRVAVLAGEGYTNQEISEQLFITASTVEQHLTKVFRKLNVKRRQDLP